jgi:hypothetical protein
MSEVALLHFLCAGTGMTWGDHFLNITTSTTTTSAAGSGGGGGVVVAAAGGQG